MHDEKMPLLGAIAGFFTWLETLLSILNGPVLMLGAGIALTDLLTDGALTVAVPALLFTWAISQALGIDTQLLGCFARARTAPGWQRVGWLVLGLVLGFAAWQAGDVFAVQQSEHISESAALAQLGMNPALWLGWRAFLAVGLVALSGWTRYRTPRPLALADERAQLERELELEPLRQAVAARKGAGWVSVVRQTVNAATGKEPPSRPPTGPGSPVAAPPVRTPATAAAERRAAPQTITLVEPPEWRTNRRNKRTRTASVERRVRALLQREPGLSAKQIAKRLHISDSTASKYRRLLESEPPQQMAQ